MAKSDTSWPDLARAGFASIQGLLDELEIADLPVKEQMLALSGVWRQLVTDWHQAGWSHLDDVVKRSFVASCPPFNGKVKRGRKRCNLRHVCPFCWAYRATNAYETLRLLLQQNPKRELDVVVSQYYASPSKTTLLDLFQYAGKHKTFLIKSVYPPGTSGFVNSVITPAADIGWHLTVSFLLIVPVGSEAARLKLDACESMPESLENRQLFRFRPDSNPEHSVAAVSTALRYPVSLVTAAPGLAAEVLHARHSGPIRGPRLFDYLGTFRKYTPEIS